MRENLLPCSSLSYGSGSAEKLDPAKWSKSAGGANKQNGPYHDARRCRPGVDFFFGTIVVLTTMLVSIRKRT